MCIGRPSCVVLLFVGVLLGGASTAPAQPPSKRSRKQIRDEDPNAGGLPIIPIYSYVSINMVRTYVKGVPPYGARVAGGLGLLLWIGIIVIGRMMAYEDYWFGS